MLVFCTEISDIGGVRNDIGHRLSICMNIGKILTKSPKDQRYIGSEVIYWQKIERGVTRRGRRRRAHKKKIADFFELSSLHRTIRFFDNPMALAQIS